MGARHLHGRRHRAGGAAPSGGEPDLLKVVAIVGPTASAKSELALALAEDLQGEILSVDSMQVYRGMDIGTAKPSREVRRRVPHHLVDLAEPEEMFTVAEFQRQGRTALADLDRRDTTALIVGGSGLHLRALVDPMRFPPTDARVRRRLAARPLEDLVVELLERDPAAGDHVDMANPRRVLRALEILELTGESPSDRIGAPEAKAVAGYEPIVPFVGIGLDPGARLPDRITARFDAMLAAGLVEEVADLAGRLGPTARQAVGYQQLLPVVAGDRSLDEGRRRAIDATRALAGRQRTWFRRDPRIRWVAWEDDAGARRRAAHRVLEETAPWIS